MTEKVKKVETEGNYYYFFLFLPATPMNKYTQLASHTLRLPVCSEQKNVCLKGLNILQNRTHTQKKTWRGAPP